MSDLKVPRELEKPGFANAFFKTLYKWYISPIGKQVPESERNGVYFRWYIAHLYFSKIGPSWQNLISKMTAYFPFSLMFSDRLYHANNIKARNLMREMESVAANKKMPIYIKNGYADRNYSVFLGIIEKKGQDKESFLKELQTLLQAKYGNVYVQNQESGFRILIDNQILNLDR